METTTKEQIKFNYTPDKDIKLHTANAIKLLCSNFQSHESGLPEWLKNSSDAYARENISKDKRIIIIIFDYGRTETPASIACLDFCGMDSQNIEQNFRNWADPEASKQGKANVKVQGGHGNGGKCYMTQMFSEYSLLFTVKNGKGNRYGVRSNSIAFGYVPDLQTGKDFTVSNVKQEMEKVLKEIRSPLSSLPEDALKVISTAKGFTLIKGVGPKGYPNRINVKDLVSNLIEHPQMINTIEHCNVYVIKNGEPYDQGRPLKLQIIPPMEGAEEPRIIYIPEVLKDPVSKEKVSTTSGSVSEQGILILKTSNKSMRLGSASRKSRHRINYETSSGYIGYVGVSELGVQSPYCDYIYGSCSLKSLEQFKQNDRTKLAESHLSRAIENFISEQVQEYAKEFELKDKRKYNQKEKSALSRMNEALDHWKNEVLKNMLKDIWGAGKGGVNPPRPPKPTGKAVRIELTLSYKKAGVGVSLKPDLKFFDKADKEIRPVPYKWISEDTNVAMPDEGLGGIINTYHFGKTKIYARTEDGKIKSNEVELEVVRIKKIEIAPEFIEVQVGSRCKLNATCHLGNGETASDVCLVWSEDNQNIAKVSSNGLVFGFEPGETTVIAGDDKCVAGKSAKIKVLSSDAKPGSSGGYGYPRVLLSDTDLDPDTGETVSFKGEDPPVWQRPQDSDRNIWWINSSAPMAKMYLNKDLDYGYESREWRMYHLERFIDIMAQITIYGDPEGSEQLSANDWILKWGEKVADIQTYAAVSLKGFISNGELPLE